MSTAYEKKRDFTRTAEPRWKRGRSRRYATFVIQKHDAARLHYDLRLEVDGVLKSWAVPRGPSTDPKVKRLAIPTEDHPLDYAGFEGVIPEGQYGAGTVLVWDRGRYANMTKKDGDAVPMAEALRRGHALFWLHGQKLKGGYALQRTGKGKSARWLLIKMKDEAADARREPVSTEPKSVLSGRTLEQIASVTADRPSRTPSGRRGAPGPRPG